MEDKKYCKDCRYYTQPKCNLHDEFTARKKTCSDFKKGKK